MYTVSVCVHCKQVIQVAEPALGKLVRCPLCGQATPAQPQPALPVAEPLPEAAAVEEPLSLDEAEQLPPRPGPARLTPAALAQLPPLPAAPGPRAPYRRGLSIAGSLFLALLAVAVVYFWFRYGSGDVPESAWRAFRPPEGRCQVLVPGNPEAFDTPPEAYASVGGRRFTVDRWFEKVTVSLAWIDFMPEQFRNNTTFEQAVMAERDRELKRLGGKKTRDIGSNYVAGGKRYESHDVDIEFDGGKQTQRYLMEKDAAPRLYILTVSGPRVRSDHPVSIKFLNSFQPED